MSRAGSVDALTRPDTSNPSEGEMHIESTMATEEWRAIPGWEGIYEASSHGRVRSLDRNVATLWGTRNIRGVILAGSFRDGYRSVSLYSNNEQTPYSVHFLVMLAFRGPRPDGLEICHNDGNRSNNCIDNLRYDTPTANAADKVAHQTNGFGEQNSAARLTSEDVLSIREENASGASQAFLSRKYQVSAVTINDIIHRRTWGWLT